MDYGAKLLGSNLSFSTFYQGDLENIQPVCALISLPEKGGGMTMIIFTSGSCVVKIK